MKKEFRKLLKKKDRKEVIETFCLFIFLFCIIFVFLLRSPLHIWTGFDTSVDSSVYKTIALMMDKGYMPYRDTFDHKGPLIYIFNWLGNRISRYRGVWVIEFITLFVTFFCIYKIARLKCKKVHSCIILLVSTTPLFTYFEGGNLTEEYAMPFITITLYFFLDYLINEKVNMFRVVCTGVCLGGVFLLRVNMIAVWLVFCIAIFLKCISEKEYLRAERFTVYFILGFLGILVPVLVWLFINDSLQDFWDDYIKFNIAYISLSAEKTCFAEKWHAFFAFLDDQIVIIAVAISIYMYKVIDKILYGIYTCYLFVTLFMIALSGMVFPHYGMILIPAVAFPIASMFALIDENFIGVAKKVTNIVIVIYCLGIVNRTDWLDLTGSLIRTYNARYTDHCPGVTKTVCDIIKENTTIEDKISVYGNWDIIYVRSDRVHATKYSYQDPVGTVVPDIMEKYWDELKMEIPRVIVVQKEHCDDDILEFVEVYEYDMVYAQVPDSLNDGAIVYVRQKTENSSSKPKAVSEK